jgi:signal transduction histidine kinase
VRFAAVTRFRGFLDATDAARAEELALMLAAFHDLRGSWEGAQDLFGGAGPGGRTGMGGMMRPPRWIGPGRPGAPLPGTRSRFVLLDLGGTVVVDSGRELLGTRRRAEDPGFAGAVAIPVVGRHGTIGTLLVNVVPGSPLSASDEAFLASVTRAMIVVTIITVGAAFAVGILAIRRLTRPVAELTRAAERTGSGDLSVRVVVRGHDEIARLAESFNRMTEALGDQQEGRRRMIADSAHELATPVSLIQGTVEAMLDGVYSADRQTLEGLHEETLRLARLVDDLNQLSLIESGALALELEVSDLAEIARREVSRFAARAAERAVSLVVESPDGLPKAAMDRRRIGQVIANLLGNALRHTPRGGTVALRLATQGAGGLRLAVEDSGPGIPEAERGKVFERYYRVDGARSAAEGGRGLGLAIAAGIVRAHGGSMRAGASSALGGAMVVMEIPTRRLDVAAPRPL